MERMKGFLIALCGAIVACSLQASAYAQADAKALLKSIKPKDYPNDTITFVVAYPAGGGQDVTTRLLAKYVEKYIDSRVIVENRTGAGGLIGHTYLTTQAKNDGYTVAVLAAGFFLADDLLRAKGKFSYKDLEPVAFYNEDPNTWVVSTDGQFKDKSFKELLEIAKQKPNSVKVAVQVDTAPMFLAEDVELSTGVKLVKVPFQGGAPGVVAMLGGHIDIGGNYFNENKGHVEVGKAKILAQSGAKRDPLFPNVPTFNEVLGVKHILWSAWRYVAVPKGTPPERAKYLEEAISAATRDPECIAEFDKLGSKLTFLNSKQTALELDKQYRGMREFFVKTARLTN